MIDLDWLVSFSAWWYPKLFIMTLAVWFCAGLLKYAEVLHGDKSTSHDWEY